MRRGAEFVAALVVAGAVGLVGPAGMQRAGAQAAPVDAGARLDSAATELAALDGEVSQLQAALAVADEALRTGEAERDDIRAESTSKEQLEARLVAQARAYAVQRYMYGSGDTADLLAFVSALNKPADDAVWGLAALEISSEAALDDAEQVAKARAAVEERLAAAEQDVVLLSAARERRAADLAAATDRRAGAADRFAFIARDVGRTTVDGMTTIAFHAYQQAADTLTVEQPSCGLRWELLAAIGKTESSHAAGRLDVFGNSTTAIIGIPIGPDTDGGAIDGDAERDHAVGPMQFIPSTWERWKTDANGDGRADAGNIVDAATAAGRYLCRAAGELTLTTEGGVTRAILAYNPNQTYLRVVGARFEALANDLALGWFSAAALPPAPAPVADLPSNAGPDGGRPATGGGPPPPEPPRTTVQELRVFDAQALVASTTAPIPEQAGRCVGPSRTLAGRAGFLRCRPFEQPLLDPCELAPFDATLAGCLPDPAGPVILLRLTGPDTTAPAGSELGPAPPYRLLVLDGGDRCLPLAVAAPDEPGTEDSSTTTTSAGPTSTAGEAGPTTTVRRRGQDGTTTTTTSTTVAPTTAPTTAPTSGPEPAPPLDPGATSATDATYSCASGAGVLGQPDTGAALWSAVTRQPGVADRVLPVMLAVT